MFQINKKTHNNGKILIKEAIISNPQDYFHGKISFSNNTDRLPEVTTFFFYGSIIVILIFFLSFFHSQSLNILDFSHVDACTFKRINFSPKTHSSTPCPFSLKPHLDMVCCPFLMPCHFSPKLQTDKISIEDKPPRPFLTFCCYPSWGTKVNRTQIVCLLFYVKTPFYRDFLMLFCFHGLRYVFFSGTSTRGILWLPC